jgi:hypothetical protein
MFFSTLTNHSVFFFSRTALLHVPQQLALRLPKVRLHM